MNEDAKKYTSLTSYKALATHLGITKDEVVAAKDRGELSIMDLESVVCYVCAQKGWFFSTNTTAAKVAHVPKTPGVDGSDPALAKMKPTVRWEVSDNAEPVVDPYLDRAKSLKGR